ncbi:MAG: hypothetical protein CW338_06840 [Clostridiales bacterium]|nr:hypothetical protein [Clostridiales bacterium]
MKKIWHVIPAVILLLFLLLGAACAEDGARDITAECKIKNSNGKYKISRICDLDISTYWTSYKEHNTYIQLTAPEGEKIYGVYICFWDTLRPWRLQVLRDGEWVLFGEYDARYAHEYVELDGVDGVKIMNGKGTSHALQLNEIYVFTEGAIPDWVQRWNDPPEKADIMFLVAHPDDEILFFGGAIPSYAAEYGKNVVVAYMTCNTSQRRTELLNVMWACGLRGYPVIGDFWDKYSTKLDTEYKAWGKQETWSYITALFRRFKPEVVVTHDVKGEYGHGGHLVCADACVKCADYAADEKKYTGSLSWGTWQVKKVYLHLGRENTIEMDWDQPLSAFDGMTGFEKAKEVYKLYISQQGAAQKNPDTGKYEKFAVEPRDSKYSCYRFSLVYTKVGPDVNGNDFLENVDMTAD